MRFHLCDESCIFCLLYLLLSTLQQPSRRLILVHLTHLFVFLVKKVKKSFCTADEIFMAIHKGSVGAAVEWMLSKIPGLWKKGGAGGVAGVGGK